MRKHSLFTNLIIFGILLVFISGFQLKQINPSEENLLAILQKQAKQIITLQATIQEQEKKISYLQAQIENLKIEQRDGKIINETIQYFTDIGYNNYYCKNPKFLSRVWEYCKKWKHLAGGIKENIQLEKFMMAICLNESCFTPNLVYDKNKDLTKDFGITQINEINSHLAKLLPYELKNRDWKTDPEANIAMRYLWIADRIKHKWAWMYLRKNSWTYYARIKNL